MMSRGRNKRCPGEVMGDKSSSEVIVFLYENLMQQQQHIHRRDKIAKLIVKSLQHKTTQRARI